MAWFRCYGYFNCNDDCIGDGTCTDCDVCTDDSPVYNYEYWLVKTNGNSWTTPNCPTKLEIYAVGGGGGSGAADNFYDWDEESQLETNEYGYSGGGGGGQIKKYPENGTQINFTSSTIITYSIGAGGIGGLDISQDIYDGEDGKPTTVTINNITFSAAGGKGSEAAGVNVYGDGGNLYAKGGSYGENGTDGQLIFTDSNEHWFGGGGAGIKNIYDEGGTGGKGGGGNARYQEYNGTSGTGGGAAGRVNSSGDNHWIHGANGGSGAVIFHYWTTEPQS